MFKQEKGSENSHAGNVEKGDSSNLTHFAGEQETMEDKIATLTDKNTNLEASNKLLENYIRDLECEYAQKLKKKESLKLKLAKDQENFSAMQDEFNNTFTSPLNNFLQRYQSEPMVDRNLDASGQPFDLMPNMNASPSYDSPFWRVQRGDDQTPSMSASNDVPTSVSPTTSKQNEENIEFNLSDPKAKNL